MARKKVIDLNADKTIKFGDKPGCLKKGSTFSGYYIGAKNVTTSMGPSVLHVFQTDTGNVGVWGSAQLNAKLASCLGMKTFIKFVNVIKVPKGMMKSFEVEYDDEDTIDVAGAQVNFRDGNEPEAEELAEEPAAEDEGSYYEEDAPAEEEEALEAPAPARRPLPQAQVAQKPKASAPSPEAQARTAALLKGRK